GEVVRRNDGGPAMPSAHFSSTKTVASLPSGVPIHGEIEGDAVMKEVFLSAAGRGRNLSP
ncbi:hypothetical protein ABTU73_17735, partial [Acinetobacter baumannii]